ncbi:MAG: TauD/TfdA dioxygenase family protein [Steroidobacteraceae bacterium]
MKETFGVRLLTPALGAEITGLDLSRPLSPGTAAELRRALTNHQVIFFRDQELLPGRQVDLAAAIGEPEPSSHPKFGHLDGHPEVALVVNDQDNPPDINVWHTDLTYLDSPPAACVLYCVEAPPLGGDTVWASMTAAWQALSLPLQEMLLPLQARHALRLDGIPLERIRALDGAQIESFHPVVTRHEDTGLPSLFVNRVYTRRIEGIDAVESERLLPVLCSLAERLEFQVRFRWEKGSIAIWDNRATQHYAVADYFPARRVMHRVSVRGSRPVAWSA